MSDQIDSSTITIFGKTKDGKGFVISNSKEQKKLILDLLYQIHDNSIKLLEVKGLEVVSLAELVKNKEVGDD